MAPPSTAILTHAIGQELAHEGRLTAAAAHYRAALARLPGGHPHAPSLQTALAQVCLALGEPSEALTLLEAAMQGKRGAFSPQHPFIAFTWIEVADALVGLARADEAEDAYARALAILERRLGAAHPKSLECHLALARLAADAGRGDEARAHAAAILASAPAGARARGDVQATIGRLAHAEGRIDEAIAARGAAALELEAALSPTHEDALAILHDLGRAHLRGGDPQAALATFSRALEGHQAGRGHESEAAATILHAIGQTLFQQGRYQGALEHYHKALAIRQRLLGARHPQTLTAQFNCGTAMRQLGDPFGLGEMEGAAETLEEILGAEHPHVLALRAWLR